MDNILKSDFATLLILLLTEMKENTEVIALDASGEVYHIDSVIEEIKQNTILAQDFAKKIIGTAFEITKRNAEQNHFKRNKEAQELFDDFMAKYGKWLVTDKERDNE